MAIFGKKEYVVKVYDIFNNTFEYLVPTKENGREYAKRIITEGLWRKEGDLEIFYPVHEIVKVTVGPR